MTLSPENRYCSMSPPIPQTTEVTVPGGENEAGRVGAGDDQRVEPLLFELRERSVMCRDVVGGRALADLPLRPEQVDMELSDSIGSAEQAQELAFGRLQGRIGHHIEHADVQLANILVHGAVQRQDLVPARPQPGKGRQIGVFYQRHRSPYITFAAR